MALQVVQQVRAHLCQVLEDQLLMVALCLGHSILGCQVPSSIDFISFYESFSFHSKCFQGGGGMGGHGDFGPGGGQQSVQGPLAYLERTTSNIGGGMGAMGPWGGMGMMNR